MTKVRSTLIACALAVSAFASTKSAVAQLASTVATVNVPFPFQIDKKEMPAGLYQIDHESSTLFRISGPTQSGTMLTHPMAVSKVTTQGFVAFHRIGDTYFLGGLRIAGNNYEMACFQSQAEKRMLQESKQQVPSLTTLAFNSTPRR
jgi:hypothetical protein